MLVCWLLGLLLWRGVTPVSAAWFTAKKDTWDQNAVMACASYLAGLKWNYTTIDGAFYSSICSYEPAFGSWTTCILHTVNEHDSNYMNSTFEKSLLKLRNTCGFVDAKYLDISIKQYYESLQNASKYINAEFNENETLAHPIVVPSDIRTRYANAYHIYSRNLDLGTFYGTMICAYFIAVLVIVATVYFSNYRQYRLSLLKSSTINILRGTFLIPTTFSTHASYFRISDIITGILPTTLETLVLCGYSIINIAALTVDYTVDPYNIIFPSKSSQLARYIGDRAGIVSFAHFPLIIFFSARNNIFESMTDLNYSTFIAFHKWIGRTMVADAIVHSLAYTCYATWNGTYKISLSLLYWKFGISAVCIASAIVLFSFAVLRKNYYEIFLYTHIILSMAFLYMSWKHVEKFGWKEWIQVALFLWIVERFMRLFKIYKFGITDAKLHICSDELLKVTIPEKNATWRALPGQYVYIYFLKLPIFFQSHPFTVVDNGNDVTIVMKCKSGLTKWVHHYVQEEGGHTRMKVALEGPYGVTAPLTCFDSILLLAAGSGIPGPLSHAVDLSKDENVDNERIHLLLLVTQVSFLEPYKKVLAELQDSRINIQIYTTRTAAPDLELSDMQPSDLDENNNTNELLQAENTLENYMSTFASLFSGKPDVPDILQEYAKRQESTAVLCCGPPTFVDYTRNQVASTLIEYPDAVLEYFEEYQCW